MRTRTLMQAHALAQPTPLKKSLQPPHHAVRRTTSTPCPTARCAAVHAVHAVRMRAVLVCCCGEVPLAPACAVHKAPISTTTIADQQQQQPCTLPTPAAALLIHASNPTALLTQAHRHTHTQPSGTHCPTNCHPPAAARGREMEDAGSGRDRGRQSDGLHRLQAGLQDGRGERGGVREEAHAGGAAQVQEGECGPAAAGVAVGGGATWQCL